MPPKAFSAQLAIVKTRSPAIDKKNRKRSKISVATYICLPFEPVKDFVDKNSKRENSANKISLPSSIESFLKSLGPSATIALIQQSQALNIVS